MKTEPTAPGRRAPEDAPPFNHGLALARILLCFLVVCCHAYRDGGVLDPLVLPLKKTAVPAFFSISCLLAAPAFEPGAGLRALSRRIARISPVTHPFRSIRLKSVHFPFETVRSAPSKRCTSKGRSRISSPPLWERIISPRIGAIRRS